MTEPALTVLVVDDEPDMVDMLARRLTQRGYVVATATSGDQAVALARTRHFDLAITDLKMPGMDGIETTAALMQVNPKLVVIVATGYATPDTIEKCFENGASEYLRKPFTLDDLDSLLRRVAHSRG